MPKIVSFSQLTTQRQKNNKVIFSGNLINNYHKNMFIKAYLKKCLVVRYFRPKTQMAHLIWNRGSNKILVEL